MVFNKDSASTVADLDPRVRAALWTFSSYLRRRGLRSTSQRRVVLAEVMRQEGHFDAESLHEELRRNGSAVSLATVYRTLALLHEAGLIRETVHADATTHYEAAYGHAHHDHMVCVECGKVIEFCDERIEELQRKVCRERGFQALDHRMGIRGVCSECRRPKANEGTENAD